GQLSARAGKRLQAEHESLNLAELNREIEELRKRLFDLVEGKQEQTQPRRRGRAISLVHSRPLERRRRIEKAQ
ncbi:MAG: hypothetical protein M3Y57_12765, partial [Acidobacteriota bacterium]|nr:hypothetical protein [Acidobacteriota bacterium]